MSDIRAIRNQLRAWPSINDPKRYYVNDWTERIQHELGTYLASHPGCPSVGLLRKVGRVWYDPDANVHVENIYDRGLSAFIAETMERTQFHYFDPGDFVSAGDVIDWGPMTDALPHEMRDETYFFEYKGETYPVNVTVYCWERENNMAVRNPDGSITFDSMSGALWELVVRLLAESESERPMNVMHVLFGPEAGRELFSGEVEPVPGADKSKSSPGTWQGGREWPEPSRIEPTYDLNPDDPEGARIEGRGTEPKSDQELSERVVPRPTFRRLTDEEIERMSREAAAETTHPKTGWTKAEVMDVARRAGVPEEQLAVLSRMKLDEIRSTCLIYDGTDITGNEYNSMQQRHTKFYRLDIEYIKSFGDGD